MNNISEKQCTVEKQEFTFNGKRYRVEFHKGDKGKICLDGVQKGEQKNLIGRRGSYPAVEACG
jgi:hypothetical protein